MHMHISPLAVALAGIAMPLFLVPTILVLKHGQRRREWAHRERMKALEVGRALPRDDAWPAALAAVAIGAGVPIGAFLIAWMISMRTYHQSTEALAMAMVVSLVAVCQGASLAKRLIGQPDQAESSRHLANGKPAFDPDAFDVAGRRG